MLHGSFQHPGVSPTAASSPLLSVNSEQDPRVWTKPRFGRAIHHVYRTVTGTIRRQTRVKTTPALRHLNPCGNFSDTSNFALRNSTRSGCCASFTKGSLRHAYTANISTDNMGQTTYWLAPLPPVSDRSVVVLVHLRYRLTSVPPQPNSRSDSVTCG